MSERETTVTDVVSREADGRWKAGQSANPGGKSRKLRDIERMLDEEHRDIDKMREVFARLRFLALGEPVMVMFRGKEVRIDLKADPAFMKLYLDRVLGPVKELISEDELADAPDVVIDWLRRAH